MITALKAKYPDDQGPGRHHAGGGRGQCLRRACMLAALAIAAAGSTDGDAIRQGFYKIDKYDGLIKTYDKPFSRRQARRPRRRRLRLGAVHRQPHRAGRRRTEPATRHAPMLLPSALISGLGLGSMYGLMALGFYVTYAVSGTVNFAQGSSMMLGAVLTFAFAQTLGWPHAAGDRAGAAAVRAVRPAGRVRRGAALRAAAAPTPG